jgi:hypothetical protein
MEGAIRVASELLILCIDCGRNEVSERERPEGSGCRNEVLAADRKRQKFLIEPGIFVRVIDTRDPVEERGFRRNQSDFLSELLDARIVAESQTHRVRPAGA